MSSGEDLYTFSSTTALGRKRKAKGIQVIIRLLGKYLTPDATILEVGTGRGEFAHGIIDTGLTYIGIEPSKSLRDGLARDLNIISEPIPSIQLEEQSVDMVYSYDVVEHLQSYSDAIKFFEESSRVLKPNGKIVVIAPNVETLGKLFYLYEYQHSFYTTIDRVETMLKETGFEIKLARAFLTNYGLSSNFIVRAVDRIFANVVLLFARNGLFISLLRGLLGRNFVFKVHKNLFDHIVLIGQKIE